MNENFNTDIFNEENITYPSSSISKIWLNSTENDKRSKDDFNDAFRSSSHLQLCKKDQSKCHDDDVYSSDYDDYEYEETSDSGDEPPLKKQPGK
jgi:hypothetical protein